MASCGAESHDFQLNVPVVVDVPTWAQSLLAQSNRP